MNDTNKSSLIGWGSYEISSDQIIEAMGGLSRSHKDFTHTLSHACSNTNAKQLSKLLTEIHASSKPLTQNVAVKQAIAGSNLHNMPTHKAAEHVVASALDNWRNGTESIINASGNQSKSIVGTYVTPDPSSKRDILFLIRSENGHQFFRPGGQVKTGSSQYISDSLSKMVDRPNYGRTGYIDARFVNPDGSPRVAADAFTQSQADKLNDAKIHLRGIEDLDKRAANLSEHTQKLGDSVDDVAKRMAKNILSDQQYSFSATVRQIAYSSLTAAIISSMIDIGFQYYSKRDFSKIDWISTGKKAALSASIAAGLTTVNSTTYNIARHMVGTSVNVASSAAQVATSGAGAAITTAFDIREENKAYGSNKRKNITHRNMNIVGKTSLNLASAGMILSLGPIGILPAIGTQILGRLWIGRNDNIIIGE